MFMSWSCLRKRARPETEVLAGPWRSCETVAAAVAEACQHFIKFCCKTFIKTNTCHSRNSLTHICISVYIYIYYICTNRVKKWVGGFLCLVTFWPRFFATVFALFFPVFSPLCGAAKSQVKYIFFGSQRQHTKPKCNNFLKAAFPHPVCLGFSPRLSKLLNSATMLSLQAAPKVTKIHKDTAQRPEPPNHPPKPPISTQKKKTHQREGTFRTVM